jgi:hypothetical protein
LVDIRSELDPGYGAAERHGLRPRAAAPGTSVC